VFNKNEFNKKSNRHQRKFTNIENVSKADKSDTYSYVYELECLGFIVHQLSRVMQSAISICAVYFMLLCLMSMNGGGQYLFYLF